MFNSVELQLLNIQTPGPEKKKESISTRSSYQPPKKVMPIIEEEAARHGYTVAELIGHIREKHLVECRHYAIWRAKRETGRSLPEIGRAFGFRDHSSILYAINKVEAMPPEKRGAIGAKPLTRPPALVRVKAAQKAPKKSRAAFYEGLPCRRCGGVLRYARNNKCEACEKRRQADERWRRLQAQRCEQLEAPK